MVGGHLWIEGVLIVLCTVAILASNAATRMNSRNLAFQIIEALRLVAKEVERRNGQDAPR